MNPTLLIPTQLGLRDLNGLDDMIEYVHKGGLFNKKSLKKFHERNEIKREPNLIRLIRFPDGKIFIHDGHHRVVSIFLCCRELHKDEYEIEDRDLSYYTDTSWDAIISGWITPFDPEIETRIPDLTEYKRKYMSQTGDNILFVKKAWKDEEYCKKRADVGSFCIEDLAIVPFLFPSENKDENQ